MVKTNDGAPPSPSKLFFSNALPAAAGLLLTSGVVVVDGLFVGRLVGPDALAAVALATPVLYALMAVSFLVGVGGMALSVPLLGAGKPRDAARIRSASLQAVAAAATVLSALAWVFRAPLLDLLGATGALRPHAEAYFSVIAAAYPFMMASMGFAIFLRGCGEPFAALGIGVAANAVNIVLDWLFIGPLGWGLAGAAAASAIASALNCALAALFFARRAASGDPRFLREKPRFLPGELPALLANGSSEAIGQGATMLTIWLLNRAALDQHGPAGVAAVSVMGYLFFVESMLATACAIGLAPVVGLAWGRADAATGRAARRTAALTACGIGAAAYAAAVLAGGAIAEAWTGGSREVAAVVASAFVLHGAALLFNGYNLVAAAFLTSVQDAAGSAAVALMRGLVLPVPFLLLFPRAFGPVGLWLAFPLAEAIAAAAAFALTRGGLKKLDAGYVAAADAA